MANVEVFAMDNTGIRVPYFSIKVGKHNLTPVPPKYIKSVKVSRLRDEVSATFEIHLLAPVNVFTTGDDALTLVLSTLLAQQNMSADQDENIKIDFVYGWYHGAKIKVNGAIVSTFDFNYADDDQFISYVIGGTCAKINSKIFSTKIYNAQNLVLDDSDDIKLLGNITEFSENCTKASNIIENIAKYIFDDYTISVDHSDKEYSAGEEVHKALGISSKPDGSSTTLYEYFKLLIRSCKEWDATAETIDSTIKKDVSFYNDYPTVNINGEDYVASTDMYNDKSVIQALKYDPFGSSEYVYPFDNINLDKDVTNFSDNRDVKYKLVKVNDTWLKFEPVDSSLISVKDVVHITRGSFGESFKLYIDPLKKILKVSPKLSDNVQTFNISNTNSKNEVLEFSVSSNGIKAISGVLGVLQSGETTSLDVVSGGTLVSTTNLGGLVPVSKANLEGLYDTFINSVAETVSSYTSAASLKLYGSAFTVSASLADTCLRILPTVNGGETFWCGDYMIDGITDIVDENGFISEFSLAFGKSKFNDTFDKKVANAGTNA